MNIEIKTSGDFIQGATMELTPAELLLVNTALARTEIGNFHRMDVETAHLMSAQIRKAIEKAIEEE